MDILNNLFTNLYDWLNASLHSLLSGAGLRPDAESAIVAAIMGLVVITVILLFGVGVVLSLIYLERKVVARLQNRLGPNRVGPLGILQPVADTIKMFIKEDIVPANADRLVHTLAPMVVIIPTVLAFAVVPFGRGMAPVDLNIGILYLVAVGSVGTIGILMAGWGSNNKFALIGGMRAVAQIISYEVPQVLAIVPVILMAGSLSLVKIVEAQSGWGGFHWFIFAIPVGPIAFVIFYIAGIAENNRTPFDLPEAESEIVAGHHTEYSGMKFGLFYLAEYFNLFIISAIGVTLFFGGWQGPLLPPWLWFLIKTYALMFVAMWMRGTWPRIRMDQLMKFAWQVLVPIALVNIVLTSLALPVFKAIGLL